MGAIYVWWHFFNGRFRAIFAIDNKQFKAANIPSVNAKISRFSICPDRNVFACLIA